MTYDLDLLYKIDCIKPFEFKQTAALIVFSWSCAHSHNPLEQATLIGLDRVMSFAMATLPVWYTGRIRSEIVISQC